MKEHQGIYQNLRYWLTKRIRIEQPQNKDLNFEEQLIYLDSIFESQSQEFAGAICNDLLQSNPTLYLRQFKNALDSIAYWHCHGRAIQTFLPLPTSMLLSKEFVLEYEQYLMASQLPVGLIRVPLLDYRNLEMSMIEYQLLQLQRLGLILELKNFSGSDAELVWLNSNLFKGVHISIGFVRAAMMTSLSKERFDDLMITCKSQNHHTYVEGISLVHDFNFAKENEVQFCYGPLMMPPVSKHQLLKITISQLNQSFQSSPKKKTHYGK
jgi:EAL domain-containing protein (putative c-di-GMP-specific phosphodiesterase class I)